MIAKAKTSTTEGQEAEYRVVWEIDLYGKSSRDAAEQALATQRDQRSSATVFEVCRIGGDTVVRVDLDAQEEDENAAHPQRTAAPTHRP